MSHHRYGIQTNWRNGLSDWVYDPDGPRLATTKGALIDTANRLRSTLNWHWPDILTVTIERYS